MNAVSPKNIVNAADVRFKESLLVPLVGFSVALNPARNYTFPTAKTKTNSGKNHQTAAESVGVR